MKILLPPFLPSQPFSGEDTPQGGFPGSLARCVGETHGWGPRLALAMALSAQAAGSVHVSVQSSAVSLCLPKEWPLLLDGAAEVSLLPALRAEHQLAEGTRGLTLGSGLCGPAG